MPPPAWIALIRTHHITSRKKVAKLKQAALAQAVFVLLRSGSSPGIMYVEGSQAEVEDWVGCVNVSGVRFGPKFGSVMLTDWSR